MLKLLREKKGFTYLEVLFVAAIFMVLVGTAVSVWVYTSKTWTGETDRTYARVDAMGAIKTIRRDLRLSNAVLMSFYPENASSYTAISMPLAEADVNGFFALDAEGKIVWDKTVIYHVYNGTLRRTVFDLDDNVLDEDERYDQLESVVLNGEDTLGTGGVTDENFLENLDTFEISPSTAVIDFYDPSDTAVKSNKVILGWIKLDDGSHDIRFKVTGKNAASSGYSIGIDSLMIEPSGSIRDAEYYAYSHAPNGSLDTGVGTARIVENYLWNNNGYLEYPVSIPDDDTYVEFSDIYDLYRESDFSYVTLRGTETSRGSSSGNVYTRLVLPSSYNVFNTDWWRAATEAHDMSGNNGAQPGGAGTAAVIRTVVTPLGFVTSHAGNKTFISLRFHTYFGAPLRIESAYITRKDPAGTGVFDGYINTDPTGQTIEEFHTHQQLFFKDSYDFDDDGDTDEITPRVWLPAETIQNADIVIWSEQIAFPVTGNDDYFITFYVHPDSLGCKEWIDAPSTVRSYYLTPVELGAVDPLVAAGTPDWSALALAFPPIPTPSIYAVDTFKVWNDEGFVESKAFDTAQQNPSYGNAYWHEELGNGSSTSLKVRAFSMEDMSDAPGWWALSAFTSQPASLAGVPNLRYVQFQAKLNAGVFWEANGADLSYEDYITTQIALPEDYQFPDNAAGIPYIAASTSPTIDDIEIQWPSSSSTSDRICAVKAYMAKRSDYGQAEVTVDGKDLIEAISIHVKTSKSIGDRTVDVEDFITIEPRNTGK